ncbi:truncated non-functional calcium-binding mitochondrial carrier Sal1p-1 [Monosporozyma servazzii]
MTRDRLWDLETPDEKEYRYRELFKQLDLERTGEIDRTILKKALEVQSHPLGQSEVAVDALFRSMDVNHDGHIDIEDFLRYVTQAELQISHGFDQIDKDNDGYIRRSEVSKYLSRIKSPDMEIVPSTSPPVDKKLSRLNSFLTWAFKPSNWKLSSSSEKQKEEVDDISLKQDDTDHYISYQQWRDFLLLMPREEGSRLKTAYSYFYLFKDDLDLSSEGDMNITNEFMRGFSYFLAGGVSGVISRTCTAPFDRIKVFLIARTDLASTLLNTKEVLLVKNPKANINKIRSPIVKAITSLYKQGGLKTFYVGNGLNSFKVFPESSIKFGTFELVKRLLSKTEGVASPNDLSQMSTYLAGGLSGVMAQFSSYPIDTLKFRMQCAPLDNPAHGNKLLINTAKQMYQEGGLRIFYRGVAVGLMGIFPYAALDLGTFSTLKRWYINRQAKQMGVSPDKLTLDNIAVIPIGAFSGSVGACVVYPINLLRTRLQAQGTFAHPYVYNGFIDCFKQTTAREGYQGLYKGLVPGLAKVIPAVSISYLCYENLKKAANLE